MVVCAAMLTPILLKLVFKPAKGEAPEEMEQSDLVALLF